MSGTQPTITRLVKQQATAERGMVATKDKLATQAGVTMLEAGGNAIDAAVAACLAIGVVEPASNSIGGGGYLVYQVGQQGGVIGFPMRGLMQPSSFLTLSQYTDVPSDLCCWGGLNIGLRGATTQ